MRDYSLFTIFKEYMRPLDEVENKTWIIGYNDLYNLVMQTL
jgi:hypothetical protein